MTRYLYGPELTQVVHLDLHDWASFSVAIETGCLVVLFTGMPLGNEILTMDIELPLSRRAAHFLPW